MTIQMDKYAITEWMYPMCFQTFETPGPWTRALRGLISIYFYQNRFDGFMFRYCGDVYHVCNSTLRSKPPTHLPSPSVITC
jgi:hypothetical protein